MECMENISSIGLLACNMTAVKAVELVTRTDSGTTGYIPYLNAVLVRQLLWHIPYACCLSRTSQTMRFDLLFPLQNERITLTSWLSVR